MSLQYRCINYMKSCRSRIIFNRENETVMKNEINHNHEEDSFLYENFVASAIVIRRFGKTKSFTRPKNSKRTEDEAEN